MTPDEREWQAQETAMRCEREGRDLPAPDALGVDYLPIARALNQPLDPMLPSDFAARVAALATVRRHSEQAESRLERLLLLGLAIVFGLCALGAVGIYGGNWLANSFSMLAQIGSPTLAWPIALAGCLALSWAADVLRRRMADHGPKAA